MFYRISKGGRKEKRKKEKMEITCRSMLNGKVTNEKKINERPDIF